MFNALIAIVGENFDGINYYYSLICCETVCEEEFRSILPSSIQYIFTDHSYK